MALQASIRYKIKDATCIWLLCHVWRVWHANQKMLLNILYTKKWKTLEIYYINTVFCQVKTTY